MWQEESAATRRSSGLCSAASPRKSGLALPTRSGFPAIVTRYCRP